MIFNCPHLIAFPSQFPETESWINCETGKQMFIISSPEVKAHGRFSGWNLLSITFFGTNWPISARVDQKKKTFTQNTPPPKPKYPLRKLDLSSSNEGQLKMFRDIQSCSNLQKPGRKKRIWKIYSSQEPREYRLWN